MAIEYWKFIGIAYAIGFITTLLITFAIFGVTGNASETPWDLITIYMTPRIAAGPVFAIISYRSINSVIWALVTVGLIITYPLHPNKLTKVFAIIGTIFWFLPGISFIK